jgi:hypothetical protein
MTMAGFKEEYDMNFMKGWGSMSRALGRDAVKLRMEAEERRSRAEREVFLRKRDPWHQDCLMFDTTDIPERYDACDDV